MATTLLEVVDSAVKIGLGALITAVASYLTTKRTQRYETRKAIRESRTALLKDIALLVEASTATLNQFVISVLQKGVTPENFKDVGLAHSKAGQAYALASLAGSAELSEDLKDLDRHLTDFYTYFRDAPAGEIEAPNDTAAKITATADRVFASLRLAQERNLSDASQETPAM